AQVEVLRGPQSLAWGSQAIGGVIAITTQAPTDALAVTARAEGGSRGSAYGVASASGRVGALGLSVSANYGRTEGISAASEARGATERDDFTGYGGAIRGLLDLGAGLSLDLRGRFQASRFGVDGFPPPAFVLADTPERSRSDEASGYAGLRWQSADGRFDQQVGAELAQIERQNSNPLNTPEVGFRSRGRTWRLRYSGDATLASWITATLGAEHERQQLRTASPSAFNPDPDPFVADAHLTGGFAQVVLRPVAGLTALAGIRHDAHSDFGGATTWGTSVSFAPGDGPIRLKASAGEGFKAPTLFQLFSDFGNPGLQPERATGWDAGLEARLGDDGLRLGATWFQRRTRDQIDFVSCFQNPLPACVGRPFGTYDNIARTEARGVELEAGLRPTQALALSFAYTWLDARNRAEGSPNFDRLLPRRPRHTAALVADWVAPAGWSVGATLSHASDSFDNAANTRRIQDRVLLDLRASVPLGDRFEAYGRVTNLTDSVYETASFYGQPGREFAAGVRARF
ncbi:MAG: TonB-dependent receptor, partial [Sphingomonadaceae bacterium]